jgi:hypothetical protein
MKGEGEGVDLGADPGGFTEVGEIGGEAIAQVDCCSRESTAKKGRADGKTRLGKEMRMALRGCGLRGSVCLKQRGELGVSSAERAGDVEDVACVGSGAPQSASLWGRAHKHDVGKDEVGRRFRGIAACEGSVVLLRQRAQAFEGTFDPALSHGFTQKR